MFTPPYLQTYKGISTRHTCPECGKKQSFTLYLNGDTNEPINSKVGKCNRESKCGYHYTPKQFFTDNPSHVETWHATSNKPITIKPITPPRPMGTIPFKFVELSASYQSNFIRFLCEFLTSEQIQSIGDKYAIGRTKGDEVIFWQIDSTGKVRTGKIMQYNPQTGKRIKHESGAIDWVHNKLKQMKQLPDDYNLQQCFFGEHLLTIYPTATVAIVESEKSALISAAVFPDIVWLASGGIQGLAIDKCQVLKGRNVILFPDLGAFDKWNLKAKELNSSSPSPLGEGFRVRCSNKLETISTPEAKANGLDIADYMIMQLKSKPIQETVSKPPKTKSLLQSMIDKNPTLLSLINKLELVEI